MVHVSVRPTKTAMQKFSCLLAVAQWIRRRTHFDKFVSKHLSGAGSSGAGSSGAGSSGAGSSGAGSSGAGSSGAGSSGAGSSGAGSVGRDLKLQKLNYQYLTTSVAVVLVVR